MPRFIVRFKPREGKFWPVWEARETWAGTELVEALASQFGISPEDLDGWAPYRYEDVVEVQVSLLEARGIPPLRGSGLVEVVVPARAFNKFVVLRPYKKDGGRHGEPFRLRWEVDKLAVLVAWAAAGFPLEWGKHNRGCPQGSTGQIRAAQPTRKTSSL